VLALAVLIDVSQHLLEMVVPRRLEELRRGVDREVGIDLLDWAELVLG
jgi:hypothetical protein